MIGAADGPLDLARFLDEDHASVAAYVLKDAHLTVLVTQEQERHAKEFERFGITRFRHIGPHGKPGPLAEEERVLFFLKHAGIDVMGIGQAVGLINGCADIRKIGQRGHFGVSGVGAGA